MGEVAIDQWTAAAGITEGRLFRAVDKVGRMTGESLSAQAVYLVVTEAAKKIGLELAPHDARRTFAKLAHKGKAPIEQIQIALGHESIQTRAVPRRPPGSDRRAPLRSPRD